MSDRVKLGDIKPDSRNANKGTAKGSKMIVNSIQQNGFGRSGLLDKNNVAIAGNKTTEASAEVFGVDVEPIIIETDGRRPVYVKRTDLDLSDPNPNNPARKLAYADNLTSWASFELDPSQVMADIEAGFDFEAIDISLPDLGELLGKAADELLAGDNAGEDTEPEITQAEAEKYQEIWQVKPGDVWQLGRHKIACVDSTDEATVKALIGGVIVGMVWSDPPYGIEYSGKGIDGATAGNNLGQIVNDNNVDVAKLSFVVCRKLLPAAIQMWWGANYYPSALSDGHGWLIWDKEKEGNTFSGAELAYINQGARTDIFRHQWHGMIKASEHGQRRVHPTQKPVALAEWCFTKYGKPGDVIFDPFLGSGISLIAAEKLNDGRAVIGCELAPEYIATILQRWADHTGKTPQLI